MTGSVFCAALSLPYMIAVLNHVKSIPLCKIAPECAAALAAFNSALVGLRSALVGGKTRCVSSETSK